MRVELARYELQRVEDSLQASQDLAHLPISGGQLIQGCFITLYLTKGCFCSDLAVTTHGGPHSTVTHLGGISSRESSFLGVHLAQGVTFWVPTHAPKPLVTL